MTLVSSIPNLLRRRCVTGVTVLAVILAGPAAAAQVAVDQASSAGIGDGRVSAFYDWRQSLSDQRPGTMLRTEPLTTGQTLEEAGAQKRILYTSTDGITGSGIVAVSGALFLPKGTPPKGGWPVVAWAHGTVGIADDCAPSWSGRSYRDTVYLNAWLKRGYAIVASDYQGLGTPGTHPYNQMRPEAYSVLDSIRAARSAEAQLGSKVVVIGQSQGGGAAFATAAYHDTYAPDVPLLGAVGTGTPYITPAYLAEMKKGGLARDVDPALAYTFYVVLTNGDAGMTQTVLTDKARPVAVMSANRCLAAAESDIRFAALSLANSLKPNGLTASFPKYIAVMRFPTLRPSIPVMLGTGGKDADVQPRAQLLLARDACAAGAKIDLHLYRDEDHTGAFVTSQPDAFAFVDKLVEGEPVTSNCSNLPR